LYIQSTFYQVPSFLIEGDRRYSFQTPHLSARPALVVHYPSAVYKNIFNLPGLGQLMVNALNGRDYPVVSGVNLFFATMVVGINLMIDLIYPYLDPRVRYS
jgi:ABC-type microcin C transport system permease subunit YejB